MLRDSKLSKGVRHLPNAVAISKRVATSTLPEDHWMQYAKACIKPGYDYFEAKLRQLEGVVSAFKAARIFNPAKVNFLKPDCSSIDTLRCFKFLDNDQLLGGLKCELPTYLAMAENTADEIDTLVWWEQHRRKNSTMGQCLPENHSLSTLFSMC